MFTNIYIAINYSLLTHLFYIEKYRGIFTKKNVSLKVLDIYLLKNILFIYYILFILYLLPINFFFISIFSEPDKFWLFFHVI